MTKIAIIVEGGMVQTVYSQDENVTVEVLDLDISDFPDDDDEQEQANNAERAERIRNDYSYKIVW